MLWNYKYLYNYYYKNAYSEDLTYWFMYSHNNSILFPHSLWTKNCLVFTTLSGYIDIQFMVIWCVFLQVLRGDEKQDAQEEKLGDNFFSLFSSSSSKYGQRLSILQKKKRTYKEVFSSGVWSGKNMLSSEILGAHLVFTSLISYLRQDIGIKRTVKIFLTLLLYC